MEMDLPIEFKDAADKGDTKNSMQTSLKMKFVTKKVIDSSSCAGSE